MTMINNNNNNNNNNNTTTTSAVKERNMNNKELELILQDEWGDYTVSKKWFEPEEYEKLKKLADMIGSNKIVIFGYDDSIYDSAEMPNEIFWIGDFYVYGEMFKSYTWYLAPIKWRWTPGDNVWMHMSAEDTVKLYPYCIEEGCWPSIYTEYDDEGEEYNSLKIGDYFVYEEEDGKIALLQF